MLSLCRLEILNVLIVRDFLFIKSFLFFSQVVAIYIGVTLDDINIGNKGWGIVLGWNLWILLKDIMEVVLMFCFKKTRSNFLVEKLKDVGFWI